MAKTTDLSFRLDSASSEELKAAIDQIIKEGGESDPRLKNYRRFYLAAKNRENKAAKTPAASAPSTAGLEPGTAVTLKADPKEGWPEETGTVVEVQAKKGMVTVQVPSSGKDDDGLREVTQDQITVKTVKTPTKKETTVKTSTVKPNAAEKLAANNPAAKKSSKTAAAAPKKGKKEEPKGKKTPAAKKTPTPSSNGKASGPFRSVHADEPTREVVWTPRRVAIVKAMRNLKATSATAAVTAAEIAKAAAKLGAPELGDSSEYNGRKHKGEFLTKVCLDVYRTTELLHNGYALSVKHEGSRELAYYLTKKGQSCKMA